MADDLPLDFIRSDFVQNSASRPTTELTALFADRNDSATFRLRGRIDADFIGIAQSPANEQIFGHFDDVIGLRRARIGAEGELSSDRRYVAEIDLAGGVLAVRDLFLGFESVDVVDEVRIGHMREPFSLEGGTSANSFPFLERSPINVLDPARNWGLTFATSGQDKNWTLAGGVYQSGTNPSDLQFREGSTTNFTVRGTVLPWYEDPHSRLMHLGIAVSHRIPNQGVILIRERPSSPLLIFDDSSESPFTPTLRIPAHFQQLLNLQWAYLAGPFWAQAEWYGTAIHQDGGGLVFLHGSYVDVGWFLIGGQRSYNPSTGVLGAVTVREPVFPSFSQQRGSNIRGYGAWELAARFAYLDFIDHDLPPDSSGQSVGVKMPQVTLGLNWYLADRLRIMFNYTFAAPDEVNQGISSAHLFAMRLATFW